MHQTVVLPPEWKIRKCFLWQRYVTSKLFTRIRSVKDAEALALYCLLLDECGKQKTNAPYATTSFIQQETGFSRRTVQKARKTLLKLELAREKIAHSKDGNFVGRYLELVHVANWFEDGLVHVGDSDIDPKAFRLARTIKDGYALGLYALLIDVAIMQQTSFELKAKRDWLIAESGYSKRTFQLAKRALLELELIGEAGNHKLFLIAKS